MTTSRATTTTTTTIYYDNKSDHILLLKLNAVTESAARAQPFKRSATKLTRCCLISAQRTDRQWERQRQREKEREQEGDSEIAMETAKCTLRQTEALRWSCSQKQNDNNSCNSQLRKRERGSKRGGDTVRKQQHTDKKKDEALSGEPLRSHWV